jgi:hypothetical protein
MLKLDGFVKSISLLLLSFRRKPESSHFNYFWTPAFAGVTDSRILWFYQTSFLLMISYLAQTTGQVNPPWNKTGCFYLFLVLVFYIEYFKSGEYGLNKM